MRCPPAPPPVGHGHCPQSRSQKNLQADLPQTLQPHLWSPTARPLSSWHSGRSEASEIGSK